MKKNKSILQNCIAHITDDYTELWVITKSILIENPDIDHSQLTEYTMQIINDLIEGYNMVIVDQKTEKPLQLSDKEIKDLIRRRMDDLGRSPDIGDGPWIVAGKVFES